MMKSDLRIVLLVIIFLSSGVTFARTAGSLDASFGTGGIASYNLPNGGYFGGMTVQPDGKIVLGGTWNAEFGLVRFNANGTLDTTFGTGGIVKTQFYVNNSESFLSDLAVQPDGKIIAIGQTHRVVFIPTKPGTEHYFEVALARYNTNGSLDATFDGDGKATTQIGNERAALVQSATLQTDGKIVVAANVQGGSYNFTTIRYNPNGSLDTSFDGDGIAYMPYGGTLVATEDIKIQPDGKIAITGLTPWFSPANLSMVSARFNTDGSLDTSFDGDGKVTTNIDGNDSAQSLVVQSDGKIIAVGKASVNNSSPANFGLVRYNTNGSLDSTFDGDGKVSTNFGSSSAANDAVLQADGKIVTVGLIYNSTNFDMAIARYLPNGALDTSFDGDGLAITSAGSSDEAKVVALQADGKIIVAGHLYNSGGSTGTLVVARYFATAGTFADFDGDSKTDISIFRPSNGQWWLNRSSSGVFVEIFGSSSDKITPGDFTGDGKTDIAVFRPSTGEWFILRSEDFSYYSHPFGTNGDVPAPADFDNDGKTDEAVFRPSTSTWYILKSSGGVVIQQFGVGGDVPVVSDYDGDGRADIAIYRPSLGQWWIQRSLLGTIAFTFGNNTDKPVQGDYTGDGKADVAIWRPSSGEWFILRSEDFSYYSYPFGTNGDMPAPGDYDGDGRFDAAVFRPSGSTWYAQRSTAGTLIQNFGQNGDMPVPNAFVP